MLLLGVACDRLSVPVRIGAASNVDSRILAETVARQLERAGCPVERLYRLGDTRTLDRKLRNGELDAYVESQQVALTQILRKAGRHAPATETLVRSEYLKEDLLWAPPIGVGDYAVVFRKSVDRRCRAAARAFMGTASTLDGDAFNAARRAASAGRR